LRKKEKVKERRKRENMQDTTKGKDFHISIKTKYEPVDLKGQKGEKKRKMKEK
jgi:hypothetical protein